MAKLVLNDITKLDNNAITLLNDNFAKLEAAIENTLSRDGLTPNTMSGVLDMNSSKIINSAPPTANSDLARLVDVNTATEGSQVSLLRTELGNTLAVGEGDALIGHRNTNYSGTVGRTLHDKLNDIVVNAKDFGGAVGSDYTVPINTAISSLAMAGGGRLEIPTGTTISSQILITSSNIHIHFEGSCTATFTTKQCMFLFQGTAGARLQNILVTGPTAVLDGNGTNITGYTYATADDAYATIRFEFVELLRMEMMRVTNGLVDNVQIYRCSDYTLDQVITYSPVHRNGVYVFGDTDPTNAVGVGIISQVRASLCPGMGILAEGVTGCNLHTCYSNANGTSNDATILTGGIGYIRNPDAVNYPVATWKYVGSITGCKTFSNHDAGIYLTAKDVDVDANCVGYGTLLTHANKYRSPVGALVDVTGSGVVIASADDFDVSGEYELNAGYGVGAYESGAVPYVGNIVPYFEASSNTKGGIYVSGASFINIGSEVVCHSNQSAGAYGIHIDNLGTVARNVSYAHLDGTKAFLSGSHNIFIENTYRAILKNIASYDGSVAAAGQSGIVLDNISGGVNPVAGILNAFALDDAANQAYGALITATCTNGYLATTWGDGTVAGTLNNAVNKF